MNEHSPPQKGLFAFLRAYGVYGHRSTESGMRQDSDAEPAEGASSRSQRPEHRLRPFPGLRSFEPDDSDVFFGRQEHIDTLLGLLRDQQVITVLGGSGSGKSSVVRAGVIPALTSTYKIEGRLGRWYIAECKPGLRPVDELCEALWEQICSHLVLNRPNGGTALAAALGITGELRDQLSNDKMVSEANKAALRRVFDRELRPEHRLNAEGALWFASDVLDRLDRELNPALRSGAPSIMLVIDQFEELFGPDVDPRQRDDLLALLQRVFEGSQDRTAQGFYIVITMRSEQLHRCAEFPGLSEIINSSMYLIDLIDEAALREAIVRPARRVFEQWKLPLGDEETAPFDPEFVDWLLSESAKLRASLVHKPDQLPLMQHALRLIWDNAVKRWSELQSFTAQDLVISFADRPESEQAAGVGFMRGCLNVAADLARKDAAAIYAGSSSDARGTSDAERLVRGFFIALARRDDRGNWTRRLVTRRELLDLIHDRPFSEHERSAISFDETGFDEALNIFVARGYLMVRHAQEDASRRSYEVCHEALIRHWRRYQQWLNDVGDVIRALRQVAENLLPPEIEYVPQRWQELKPYGYSLPDWWRWVNADRERRAAGIVSEHNRKNLGALFGDEAKFGSHWAINELASLLRGRDQRRGATQKADEQYASEAHNLLGGIADAYRLAATPRLVFPHTLAEFPRYLVAYAKLPENRLFVLFFVILYAAVFVGYNVWVSGEAAKKLMHEQNVAQEVLMREREEANKKLTYEDFRLKMVSAKTLLDQVGASLNHGDITARGAKEMLQVGSDIVKQVQGVEDTIETATLAVNLALTKSDILSKLGDLAEAHNVVSSAKELTERLLAAKPANPQLLELLYNSLFRMGDAIADQSLNRPTQERALAEYKAAKAIADQLVGMTPNAENKRKLVFIHHKIGDVFQALSDWPGAIEASREALKQIEDVIALEPEKRERQRDLAISLSSMGQALAGKKDFDEALRYYDRALRIRTELEANDPEDATTKHNLATTRRDIAHVHQQLKNFDDALTEYDRAIKLGDALLIIDRGNAEWQEFLAALYTGAGGVHKEKRDIASAVNMYRNAYGLRQALVTKDRSNKYRQRRLAAAGMSLAGLLEEQNSGSEEALKLYGDAIDILDEWRPQYDRDVFSCYISIGDILKLRNDRDGALEKYAMASAIAHSLGPKNPSSAIWQRNLTSSYFKIGELLTAQDPSRALRHYQEALEFVSTELVAKHPDNGQWQALANSLRAKLQSLMLKP